MIGKAYKLGTGFKGLAAYLERGHRDALQPDRVDWVESRNLPTHDPEAAARVMAATARDSERVRKPVYHFSVSFDPGDPVDRETMRRVADRTLRDLGLRDHQVLIVAHRDRQHPHMHFVVNTVHPEQHRAWSNSWDYRRIEASLRAQEVELGLRVVPGRHAPVPGHARRMERAAEPRVRGDASFLERVRAEAGPHLTGARSWAEVERGLAEHGLALRIKGRGMVVTDGVREVKASEVDPAASRFRMERRLGSLTDYRARQAVAGRTLDERTVQRPPAVERAPQAKQRTPAPPAPERPVIPAGINQRPPERAPEVRREPVAATPARVPERVPVPPAKVEHRRIARSYREAMAKLYWRPNRAHALFRDAVIREGRDAAARTLAEQPEAFGMVRYSRAPAQDRARDASQEAYRWAGRMEAGQRYELRRAAAEIREYHAATLYQQARTAEDAAGHALAHVRAHRDYIRNRVREAVHHGGLVYEKPQEALRNIARSARRMGSERTADLAASAPERFGALRTVPRSRYWGLKTEYDTGPARQQARIMVSELRGLDFNRDRAASVGDVLRAREALERAQRHLRALPRVMPDPAALLRVGRVLQGMERAGLEVAAKLVPMLPTSAAGLVKQAVSLAAKMTRGRDRDRDRGMSL